MKNSTTTSFPTVGDSVLSYVASGGSGKPSSHTKVVAKQTMGRGKSPIGSAAIRGSSKIQEAQGPRCHVVAKLYKANAAEASAVQRNVRIMPSAAGVGDFWKKRQFGAVY